MTQPDADAVATMPWRRQLAHVARVQSRPGGGGGNVREAGALRSPKVAALLSLLRSKLSRDATLKCVVFSQQRNAMYHLSLVLAAESIGHVRIVGGDKQSNQELAVASFNNDPDTRVFLLHAGTAAAGLTLTAATLVVLLEPFARAGEEAQALNRCHRIGQEKKVECITLYLRDSVEERMLAWRKHEVAFGGGVGKGGGEGKKGKGKGKGKDEDEDEEFEDDNEGKGDGDGDGAAASSLGVLAAGDQGGGGRKKVPANKVLFLIGMKKKEDGV